jgi:prepilin-type N-terminal cleavage/methylation domain-containing protein
MENKKLSSQNKRNYSPGFTLMEIIVATTVFTIVVGGLSGLYSYVLRINRKSQAMRQATQGMRNFVEFLTKEVRNGQIDYGVVNGSITAIGSCPVPTGLGQNTYTSKVNRIAVLNKEGHRECIYYATSAGAYVAAGTYVSSGGTLMINKDTAAAPETLLPATVTVEKLVFFVRPLCDPYNANCASYGSNYPGIQPSLFMAIDFLSTLPTGEQTHIYYQTALSTDRYDIPSP